MYLKNIKASGFKSFADKTVIEFNEDITAVVGPNGSGKSNIVDAVRWVLGEQSVKQLRGSTVMSDVIFSGSASRDSMKKASVTLTFDNKDHYLKSEFDELEIKREVYKTGESDYFINNTRVRLKDVHNLFLDTGAGSGAFNIISQGNITEIVNSKAIDRRVIFESAAGVLKYKKRKAEALTKLEKTKDNLASIRLVIDELKRTVLPLKKQSENARKYLKLKEESSNIEIALLSSDIENNKKIYEDLKDSIETLSRKVNDFSNDVSSASIEKLKLDIIKIDEKISEINNEIILINEEIAKLSSEKQITIERQKYSVDTTKVNESLLKLKEDESSYLQRRSVLKMEIECLTGEKSALAKELDDLSNEIITLKIKRSNINASIDNQSKRMLYLQNKLEITENNILNRDGVPRSVRAVLNNDRLKGIHDTLGNIIETPLEYQTAINITLGFATNFIVTDNFNSSKESIRYLKENKLGRATFFPLDTIKSRVLSKEIISTLKKGSGFVGIASDLVKYNSEYKNVVENQLGNVIIVKDIESLNVIGQKLDYKYRVVSLDGEILYAGGAVAGGTDSSGNNLKQELKTLKNDFETCKKELKSFNEESENIEINYRKLDEKSILLNKKSILLVESINSKKSVLKDIEYHLENLSFEIKGIDSNKKTSAEEDLINLIEVLTEKAKKKLECESNLETLKNEKSEKYDEITTLEHDYKLKNSEFNKFNNDLKENEIRLGKIEVKLENALLILSEDYNLTYEFAKEKYFLTMPVDEARSTLKILKNKIFDLGEVNTGSISEYERLSERYEFLLKQEEDLGEATGELLSIIDEMDDIMVNKFKKSFAAVSKEFKTVFKEIFQGGKGELVLTDPSNLLETGIDIIAEPPGKKINSTLALSGGEKSLTAICLLFSILNVRPVPFIILDEAEAALDEANVDMFGKYISEKKKDSQFILITHKKRMMEYADYLYGITMQESGVSKIVSTKLEK